MVGYPAAWYCVSIWVMVVLCTCLACRSMSCISVGYGYKLFLIESGESLSVFDTPGLQQRVPSNYQKPKH
jgi:hypothetical protein